MTSKAEEKTLILEYEGILIHRNRYCYVVSESRPVTASSEPLQATQKHGVIGLRPSYHASLLYAAEQVSDRLLQRKLKARSERYQSDLDSLKKVITDHYKKMEEFYVLNLK